MQELENWSIDRFIEYARNPRKNDHAVDRIASAINEFGFKVPIIAKSDGSVVDGHLRLKAARKLKLDTLPVLLADDLTDAQIKAFRLSINKMAEIAEWDDELLALELEELQDLDFDMGLIGFDQDELDVLLQTDIDGLTDDDAVPEIQEESISKRGDVWLLGDHRVMCGDSTSTDDVDKLMGGVKVNLCFTSPPYWVGKDYESQNTEQEIDSFIKSIADCIARVVDVNYGRVVINTGTASINRIDKKRKVEILPLIDKWCNSLRQYGWLMRHLRIWAKRGQLPASISPRTDVIDQHNEYLAEFENEFTQIPTFWNQAGDQRGQERIKTKWAQQGLWDDVHGEKSAGGKHVAAFPVEIPSRNIRLYTKRGEGIYEPFAGSGTTIIAAEKHGRICYGMEIDNKYCDVVVKRWMDFTGREATLESTGETFNQNKQEAA